jgi:uncharacterized protein with von Willebrand factor type A (vWA) domain
VEASIHRFVRLLRRRGVRISVSETLDAMACVGQPGILAEREVLREALRAAVIKGRRDDPTFNDVFDKFFALIKVGEPESGHGHGHAHGDLSDDGALEATAHEMIGR